MYYRELTSKNGIRTKQLGNKIIAAVKPINDDTFRVYGYEILNYERYEPKTIRLQNSYTTKNVGDWGTAYNKLFGKPNKIV